MFTYQINENLVKQNRRRVSRGMSKERFNSRREMDRGTIACIIVFGALGFFLGAIFEHVRISP